MYLLVEIKSLTALLVTVRNKFLDEFGSETGVKLESCGLLDVLSYRTGPNHSVEATNDLGPQLRHGVTREPPQRHVVLDMSPELFDRLT